MGGKPGRKWGPLRSEYEELRELAAVLRGIADGHGLTLRDLENRMPYGHTAISENLNGAKRPGWRFVVAFLTACAGGDRHALTELERKIRPLWESAGQDRTRKTPSVATSGDALVPVDVRTWVAQLHETVRTLQVVTELQSSVNRNFGLIQSLAFLTAQTSAAVLTLSAERDALREELAAREADARELRQTRLQLDDTQSRLAAAERLQTEMSRRLYEALRQREEAESLKQKAVAQAEAARRRLAEIEDDAVAFVNHPSDWQEAESNLVGGLMGPADQEIADEILNAVDATLGDEAANLSALQTQIFGASDAIAHTAELSAGQSLRGASASADNDRQDRTEQPGIETRRRLRSSKGIQTPESPPMGQHGIWNFADSGPVSLVCAELPRDMTGPLTSSANPNYTELQSFADLDALMELFGHIRAENPGMNIFFRTPSQVSHDDLTGHIVLLGGVIWNEVTGSLSAMAGLPVRQIDDPRLQTGEIFVAEVDGEQRQFWPEWVDKEGATLAADVGLLARVQNPLNSSRTLTICNGIHSRGVYGAVRSLTDSHLRESNTLYMARAFREDQRFAILMRIHIIAGRAMTPDFMSPDTVLYQWSAE
jgi:hypothetical protein